MRAPSLALRVTGICNPVVKAFALGHLSAPRCSGWPDMYGADGVGKVLQIIEEETATAARLLGVNVVQEAGRRRANAGRLEREVDVEGL